MSNKALLIYSYSAKNAGDLAITLGALDLLSYNKNEISTISRYSANDEQYKASSAYVKKRYQDLKIYPSPFELNRNTSKVGVLKQYLIGFLKILGVKTNTEFKKLIQGFDKVYFNGGNLLRCNSVTDFIRLVALIYPLKFAIKSNIPVVILPQSTAKINFWGRKLLKPVLNAAEKVYCREELTYKIFKQYFPKAPLQLNTDMAFYINHGVSKTQQESKKIAITTRSQTIGDINELSASKKQQIKQALHDVTNNLLDLGHQVVFVVQTKKDMAFTHEIFSDFNNQNNKVEFFENYDPIELIKFYSTCDLLIGMRLHSIILALASGTPCVGYFDRSWGLKNPGILKAYNQKFTYLDEEKKLYAIINKLIAEDKIHDDTTNILKTIKHFQNKFNVD